MSKQVAETSNRLSIAWLKKQGYFNRERSYQSGSIKWTYGSGESSVWFAIQKESWETPQETSHMRLRYSHTSRGTDEKESMDYRVALTTTPCRYGGKRYWFICPLTKNGQYCGRRVGVLFSIGKWFGCRHCGEIAYASQMESGKYKGFVSIPDIERAEKDVKRRYYNGKPTRKYRKVIRLNEKFEMGFFMAYARINKRLGRRFADFKE